MKNHTFLLHTVFEICRIVNGERSKMGISNILYGKKNHQTWSDVHLFQLHKYYRFLFREDVELFDKAIDELQQLDLITISENDRLRITENGEQYFCSKIDSSCRLIRDGRIIPIMEDYWLFIHLLVQTLSNLLYKERSFLPVIRNSTIQAQVKGWIARYGVKEGAIILTQELTEIFEAFPEQHSEMFVLRLSGKQRIGMTIEQLGRRYDITYLEMKWQWESLLCELYKNINKAKFDSLPLIHQEDNLLLSESCKETWRLLQRNISIEDICNVRKLKEATILDHIVEIALAGLQIDYFKYLTNEEFNKVLELYLKTGSKRLKYYKDLLTDQSYFQIRLALAIISRGNE